MASDTDKTWPNSKEDYEIKDVIGELLLLI